MPCGGVLTGSQAIVLLMHVGSYGFAVLHANDRDTVRMLLS